MLLLCLLNIRKHSYYNFPKPEVINSNIHVLSDQQWGFWTAPRLKCRETLGTWVEVQKWKALTGKPGSRTQEISPETSKQIKTGSRQKSKPQITKLSQKWWGITLGKCWKAINRQGRTKTIWQGNGGIRGGYKRSKTRGRRGKGVDDQGGRSWNDQTC